MTRRLFVLRGTMQISEPVELQLFEREPREDHHRLGDVAVAGPGPVDPVPDRGALQRAAGDVVEVDLTGELLVDEHPERIGVVGGALTVTSSCTVASKAARSPGGIGHRSLPERFPRHEPLLVAEPDLAPRSEVVDADRSQHHAPPVQPRRRLAAEQRRRMAGQRSAPEVGVQT